MKKKFFPIIKIYTLISIVPIVYRSLLSDLCIISSYYFSNYFSLEWFCVIVVKKNNNKNKAVLL